MASIAYTWKIESVGVDTMTVSYTPDDQAHYKRVDLNIPKPPTGAVLSSFVKFYAPASMWFPPETAVVAEGTTGRVLVTPDDAEFVPTIAGWTSEQLKTYIQAVVTDMAQP